MRHLLLTTLTVTTTLCTSPGLVGASTLDDIREVIRSGDHPRAISSLLALEPTTTDEGERVQARFLLGRLLTEAGSRVGLGYLQALPEPMPMVDDRRLVWIARAQVLMGPSPEGATALQRALRHAKGDLERAELNLALADTEDALGRGAEAAKVLERIAQGDGPRHLRARALVRLATRAAEPEAQRRRRAKRLLLYFPDSPEAAQADLGLTVEDLSDAERLRRAQRLMKRFDYAAARPELKRLSEHPKLGRDARWELANIGLTKLRDDPEGARRLFRREMTLGGPRKEEALFSLIRTYVKDDRYTEALRLADRYDRAYPRGKYAERIGYYRGWLPYDERDCKRALPGLERYVQRFGKRKSYVRGFIAWCHIRQESWSAAVKAFDALVGYNGPLTTGKAFYWQAYALHKMGKRSKARKKLDALQARFPLTYYAMLGRQMLASWEGRDPRASQVPWPDGGLAAAEAARLDPEAWSWPRLSDRLAERFARVRALVQIDEVPLARQLYTPIREAVEGAVSRERREAFRVAMSFAIEDFSHGWKRASGGKINGNLVLPHKATTRWLQDYPRAYGPLVTQLERTHGVPAEFVYGIMRQESRYRPSAISARDAIGALQMIPQTAILCGDAMGTPYDPVTFMDPRVGFAFSTFYMARHDTRWRGQLLLTAASYNAGPSPVARWLRENPKSTLPVLIEEFSYNEARVYTRQVASHTLRNLWLYETDAKRRGEILDRMFPVAVNFDVSTEDDF